jgi:hypothetical protein
MTETHTIAQMMPQTRHYVDRRLNFDKFDDMFFYYDDFTKIHDFNCWKSIGAELFSRKWFVPGAFSRRILISFKVMYICLAQL